MVALRLLFNLNPRLRLKLVTKYLVQCNYKKQWLIMNYLEMAATLCSCTSIHTLLDLFVCCKNDFNSL